MWPRRRVSPCATPRRWTSRASSRSRASNTPTSRRLSVEDREVEPAQALGVAEDVDLGDLPAPDRDAAYREGLAVAGRDPPDGTVDERGLDEQAQPRGDE